VTEYIPAVGKVLGTSTPKKDTESPEPTDLPGPPERPTHDGSIEEFVRDQHRSKQPGDQLSG
jgi:hypothetical protein